MKWRGRERSANIEDRRGRGGIGGGLGGGFGGGLGGGRMRIPMGRSTGGLGLGGLIVFGILLFVMGINPLSLLDGGMSSGVPGSSFSESRPLPEAGQDDLADFVGVVIKETEDLWTEKFAEINETYTPPKVVLFSNATDTACGTADSRTGPFYCPNDRQVYIDLSFYDQLRQQFGAPGDFAQAYVLAHEVGHHVQNLTGVLGEFARQRQVLSEEETNAYSVRVELQADCYAGVWANAIGEENLLENGDIEEAINAADRIGDDTLQREMQGYAVPKTFTHGTSEQRKTWFQRGYQNGNPGDCDTFSGAI